MGTLTFNFLGNSATGSNTSLANAPWEWEFDYKNTTGGSTTDPDSYDGSINDGNMVAGTNSWRYWLISYLNGGTRLGLYVSQVGGNLVIRRKHDVPGSQYQQLYSVAMPNNDHTYQIRMIRSAIGYFNVYILDRTTNTTVSSTLLNITYNTLNVYNLSYLEATSTTANRFQFDNFNFYQARVDYIPIAPTASNGMTTVIYPGIVNAIPYAVNVNVRGDIVFGRFVINFSGNASNIGQALFTTGAIYKTSGTVFSVTTGTKLGNDVAVNATYTQQTDFSQINPPEYYYSPGNTNGTTANVINYFFVAQGRNPFFNNYPTTISYSVSTTNSDTFSQFFNSVSPYGTGSSSSVSTSGTTGNLWDWTGVNTDWATSGSWKRNNAASTAYPISNSDIVRIGVIAYTNTNQPDLGAINGNSPIEIGKLIMGSNNSPVLNLGNNITLTIANGIEVPTGANATIADGNNNSSISLSGGTSNVASGATLTISNSGSFTNSSDFTSQGNIVITNNFVNSATGKFTATAGTVSLNLGNGNQTITNSNTTTPVTFYNLTVSSTSGNRTKTLSGNSFAVAAGGLVSISGNTTLATNGLLTLNSNANGSASVDKIPNGASITGNVNVQRYFTGGLSTSRGYRFISSPVSVSSSNLIYPNLTYIAAKTYTTGTNGVSGGFDAAGNPTFYLYRENMVPNSSSFISGNYRGVSSISGGSSLTIDGDAGTFTLPAGNGVLAFFRGDKATTTSPTNTASIAQPTTFTASGYLNQGTISVKSWVAPASNTLLYTSNIANSVVRGFNLVGNPYACSIDWDKWGTSITGNNVSNIIYVYNPTLKVYGIYMAGSGGVGTNFKSNSGANIIPSGQGFLVRATAANPTLTFTEDAKTSSQVSSSNLLMSTQPVAAAPVLQYMRLRLSKDELNADESLIFFKQDAKPEFVVNEDAEYLKGNSILNISTLSSENASLGINKLPFTNKEQSIPLNVNITSTGLYTISLTEIKNIPKMFDAWLMDAYKKDSLDIKNNKTYNFNAIITDPASFGTNRFRLVIRPNKAYMYRLLDFAATKQAVDVKLNWKVENEQNYTYFTLERSTNGGKTFEIIGSSVGNSLSTYSLTDKAPVSGENLYRLKQEDYFGSITYSKVVPVMYTPKAEGNLSNVNVLVYPNPTSTNLNVAVNKSSEKAALYKITITNSSGLNIKTVQTSRSEWSGYIGDLLPGNYFLQVVDSNNNSVIGNSKFVKL